MNSEDYSSLENMFQNVSSAVTSIQPLSSTSKNDQDELLARKKLEQKRLFQQKQGKATTDVDSLMHSMFTDLKLKPKITGPAVSDLRTSATTAKTDSLNHQMNLPCPTSSASIATSGAADWSKIVFDDELQTIFRQAEHQSEVSIVNTNSSFTTAHSNKSMSNSIYPEWCCQPVNLLPLVYQQVFEASYSNYVIQTSILYPILLLSGLPQEQLGRIWSQVNLTQPGTLVKEELFMALALIALAQNNNGNIYSPADLRQLKEIPIPNFQLQKVETQPSAEVPKVHVESVSTTYQQDEFADFTSFPILEQSIPVDNNCLLDLEDNHLCPPMVNQPSSETQSITSLDLPMPSSMINTDENSIEKEIGDPISFTLSINNDSGTVTDPQSIHSNNFIEQPKLELTQFSFFSDDSPTTSSTLSIWIRCFEKCHSILLEANNIFASIESPILCTDILQQNRAKEYVYHLQEIFHVHKRIYTAASQQTLDIHVLTNLWKQIIVLWTNLQPFFSTAHLHLVNDDDIDYSSLLSNGEASTATYCSLCLLSTDGFEDLLSSFSSISLNHFTLTFAGRWYHAPCANFYLNLIDGILPSLQRPALL